jgi:hypothetical protein
MEVDAVRSHSRVLTQCVLLEDLRLCRIYERYRQLGCEPCRATVWKLLPPVLMAPLTILKTTKMLQNSPMMLRTPRRRMTFHRGGILGADLAMCSCCPNDAKRLRGHKEGILKHGLARCDPRHCRTSVTNRIMHPHLLDSCLISLRIDAFATAN